MSADLIAKGRAANSARIESAHRAVDAFVNATNSRESMFSQLHPDDGADAVADLLCNLRHFANCYGLDFDALNARAGRNFDHESAADYMGD